MDERAIKRLLVIFAVSIIAIWLFKSMMSKTIINLNKAAAEKKQAAATSPSAQQATPPASGDAIIFEAPPASAAGEVNTMETQAASGASEVR